MPREVPSLERIRDNPTLHPLAFKVVEERFPDLKWHSHADSPDSSQAFALSAFVPVLTFEDRDDILERFVTGVFPAIPRDSGRSWQVIPEFVQPGLLGETGLGEATNIDVLLLADDAAMCVESKFRVDALEGFGKCSQATSGDCKGFHGHGSDAKQNTDVWCRLTVKDGYRDPRKYWELGCGHFRDEIFLEQRPSQVCPFRDTYQLMRNYLTASELARQCEKSYFGVIGVVPEARADAIVKGVRQFKEEVLLPENVDRVAAVLYEDYIEVLDSGSTDAKMLADFLRARLS